MKLTERQATVIRAVLEEVLYSSGVHYRLGSETQKEAREILSRIRAEPYCKRNGIRFENLTEDDYMQISEEEYYKHTREGLDIDE